MKLYLNDSDVIEEENGKFYLDLNDWSILKVVALTTILLNVLVLGSLFIIGILLGFA